ncbi:MAG: protein-L-isoaspartate O-methyltransferase [Parvibaculum sp.]
MTDFAAARINMVENQVRCNAVTDFGVITAMSEVAREKFAPAQTKAVAYMDQDLNVGHGRYLMQPRAFAKLCQAAAISGNDTVLDVGCATGYSSAVLARIAAKVVALEENPELAEAAKANLAGIAVVVTGPLNKGVPDQGPYDVILLNGSIPAKPDTLCEQLAEGGRLMVIIGDGAVGHATIFVRANETVTARVIFDSPAQPLPGFEVAKSFVF